MAFSRSTRRSPLAVMSLAAEAFGTVESAVHRDERRVGAVVRSYDKQRVCSCVCTVIYSFHRGEVWDDVLINERPSSDDQTEELKLDDSSPAVAAAGVLLLALERRGCCRLYHRRCGRSRPLSRRSSAPRLRQAARLQQRLNPPFRCSTRSSHHIAVVVVGQ